MTNHPKTLEEALEMFDEKYGSFELSTIVNKKDYDVHRDFITTIWHAGRESVVEDCEGMKQVNNTKTCAYCRLYKIRGEGMCNKHIKIVQHNETLSDVITKLSELKK